MSRAAKSEIPADAVEQKKDELEKLSRSDLPVSEYADRLLEIVEEGGDNQ